MPESAETRRSPLDRCHEKAGGRMVDFAGWRLPVEYSGLVEEHRAVRGAAGLFDVSHMGELRVRGAGAEALVQRLTPNNVERLEVGQAHYSAFLTPEGTYIDDLIVYKLGADDLLLVVNAANAAGDYAHVCEHASSGVSVDDVSDDYALLALQGPRAAVILARLTAAEVDTIGYYRFVQAEVAGAPAILSRTGYTGEDGFELYVPPDEACGLWDQLVAAGASDGLKPAGLGARDTLRLEAGMALYGHEIDRTTDPFEAGLGWTVKLKAGGDFVGREALVEAKKVGPRRRLFGIEVEGRGPVPRQGYTLLDPESDAEVGRVTSGTWSPSLEKRIGIAYLARERAQAGAELDLEVRGRRIRVAATPLPFYRRQD